MDTLKDSVVITVVTLDKIQWQCAILVTKEVNPDDPIYIQNSRNAVHETETPYSTEFISAVQFFSLYISNSIPQMVSEIRVMMEF